MRCTILDPGTGTPVRLQVDFHKAKREVSFRGKKKELIDTLCVLHELRPNGMKNVLAEAGTFLNPLDKYNKRIGKKIALQRLLEDIYSEVHTDEKGNKIRTWYSLFSTKQNRKVIWDNFKQTFKRWR